MNADNNTRPNATNKIESNLKRVLLAKVAKMIADMDKDHDGKISREE